MGELVMVMVAVATVVVVSTVWRTLNRLWLKPLQTQSYLRKQGINGPSYKFYYGDLKEMMTISKQALTKPMSLSHQILPRVSGYTHQIVQKYGKLSFAWYGTTVRVHIMDPNLIKEVLANKSGDFNAVTSAIIMKYLVSGLGSYDGEKWAKHRKILNPSFRVEKLKMMLPSFYTSCSEMISKWRKLVPNSGELDVWAEFQILTGDVISRSAFGVNFEKGQRISKLQIEQAQLVMQSIMSLDFPGARLLPTKRNKRMNEIRKELTTLLTDMIHEREKAMKMGETNSNDLLSLLIESNFKEIQDNANSKKFGMSIDDVIEECKQFYFAGKETTSTLLAWSMVVLSIHPEWQTQAREEVLQVFGEGKPDFDGLSQLKIVTMILYEVLRLYPPVALMVRVTNKTVKLGEISLPSGVHVTLPVLNVQHDHELWGKDAEEFNPGRFSEGILKATNDQVSFFPFGWGPRICIGQNFALLEAKLALAMILQVFSFDLSPKYIHAPYTLLTLQPQHGVQVILQRL